MLNFPLNNLPERTEKPRSAGLTMVMDKGMAVREAEDFLSVAGQYADVIKLGWTTSMVTGKDALMKKLDLYRNAGIPCYFGGTMLEAFVVRGQFEDYFRIAEEMQMPYVEVSNGSIEMSESDKLGYISRLAKKFKVVSEVGSKDSNKDIPPYKWVEWMKNELDAGAWKVIAEARESGTVGVFSASGEARGGLIEEILHHVPGENIIWEAPQKNQQIWFIKRLGSNVNLGNIAPNELIPLETLRLGLRGDTFHTFLKD